MPGPRRPIHDEEPLVRIALRRAVRRVKAQATTPDLGRLLALQASGGAGDTLVALALAGSLFFSVPEAAARNGVLLYLGLTMAPFALAAPFLSAGLDRWHGSLRWGTIVSSVGRALLAWLLAGTVDSALLFPIALGILVLSRGAVVVKGALLPQLVSGDGSLVRANSSVAKTMALSGFVVSLPGILLVRWPGAEWALRCASIVYLLGVVPAFRLPAPRGRREVDERVEARATVRSASIRGAMVATAGVRMLVGFLVFHLAFALRSYDMGAVGLSWLIGCAALGGLSGAAAAPRLRRRLMEEGIIAGGLLVAGVAALVTGRWFSLVAAGGLVFFFGLASGAVKLSFDSIVQRDIRVGARGWAFARFESVMQLAWVIGALFPVLITIPGGPGVAGVGVAATGLAGLYSIGRRNARRMRPA